MVTTRERKTQTDGGFTGLFMLSTAMRRPDFTSIEAYLGNESAASAIQDARRSTQNEAETASSSSSASRSSSAADPQGETNTQAQATLTQDFSGARGDLSAAREGRVIVWGDSIARGLAGHLSAQGGVVNIGRDGAGLLAPTQTRSLSEVPGGLHRGDTVVISIGTNDIDAIKNGGERALARFEAALTERIDAIRAAGATPVLLDVRNTTGGYTGGSDIWQSNDYVTGWNRTAERLNRFFTAYSSENGIAYVRTNHATEISSDNLHPSSQGFGQIARALTLG
ncbi:MAG: SGNH/GDSL hydrolase family protein [Pseudobdellovibrionaceae bacterium]